jgi:hypothetical protein
MAASVDFLRRRYRYGRSGLRLVVMYDYTRQPPCEHNEHKIGKVPIHRQIIAVLPPRQSSNHAVRAEWRRLLPGIIPSRKAPASIAARPAAVILTRQTSTACRQPSSPSALAPQARPSRVRSASGE